MKFYRSHLFFFLFFLSSYGICFTQSASQISTLEEKLRNESSVSATILISLELSKLYSAEDLEKALNYAEAAYKKSVEYQSYKDQANSLNQIGKINMLNNNYDQALESFINSLNINKQYSDLKGAAISNILIGDVYREIGDEKRARNQYEQALQIGMKTKNLITQSVSNLSLGKLENKVGNQNLSLQYLILSNEQISLTNETSLKAEISYSLGMSYVKSNQFNKATQILTDSRAAAASWVRNNFAQFCRILQIFAKICRICRFLCKIQSKSAEFSQIV